MRERPVLAVTHHRPPQPP
jgi:hypothetical protein